ncbi:hypothetical protein D3C73_1447200 [compost metagenome]
MAADALLLEQNDQRLLAGQNALQRRHIAPVQGDCLLLKQVEQFLGRGDVVFDQLQQCDVVHG